MSRFVPRREFAFFFLFVVNSFAQMNVPTERYDLARTGANLNEAKLNISNVNVNSFGKLWTYPVNGSVFAQPLYISGVTIPSVGVRNVVYIVTMNDVVYAFDADSSSGTPLWSRDLTTLVAGSTPVPITDIVQSDSLNIVGNVGIESTPVIDTGANTMYLVARTKENGQYFQRLHALDITTGAEKFGGPVIISGSVPGTGANNSGGNQAFVPLIEDQRSGLALTNGQIFIAWSSHEDLNAYHGWVMSYSASTLRRTGIFCDTPNGSLGGIWMSGRAPAVDSSGNVYYMTGNGTWDGVTEFGESFLKFSPNGLSLVDWFTPDNYGPLNNADEDLGSSGPILIPGTNLIVGGGKQSLFYLMNTANLGHENATNGQIVQSLNNNGGEIKSGPVYWNRNGGVGPWMYVWADSADTLNAYHFNGSTFDAAAVSRSKLVAPNGASGGVLALSANGSAAGTGIVWSSMPGTDDGDHGIHAGILRALDADDLTRELWDSNQNASRDGIGNWPKFSTPLVANGRVYLGGYPSDGVSNATVSVFGLITSPSFTLSASSPSVSVNQGAGATSTISVVDSGGFSGAVTLAATGLPSGVAASFGTNPTGGSSVLTLAASGSAVSGTYTVTVTGNSGSVTATTSIALTVGTPSCAPTAIVPYIQVNGAAWQQISSVTIASGSSVNLGPQPLTGTWSWTGPNGFVSTAREIDSIPLSVGVNNFVATYTNSSSCKSAETFVVTVTASAPLALSSVLLNPSAVVAGNPSTGTVTFTQPAPAGGLIVYLWSGNGGFSVPVSVTVSSGAKTATFPVTATILTDSVYANYQSTTVSTTLTVTPVTVAGVTLNPASVPAGTPSTGTVTLTQPAPAGGLTVDLWTDNGSVGVPSSITVPAGSKTASFAISTSGAKQSITSGVTAYYSGTSVTATLSVTAAALAGVSVNPTSATAGTAATGTVTLSQAAPTGGIVVYLWSNNGGFIVPVSVTVPTGSKTATFPITNTSATDKLYANYLSVFLTATLTVK